MGYLTEGGLTQSRALLIDSAFNLVIGLGLYFAPDKVADFVFQRKTDGVHWHLIRCIGGQLLSFSYVSWCFNNSKPVAKTVVFLIKIIHSILLLLIVFQCQSQTPQLVNSQVFDSLRVFGYSAIAIYVGMLLYNGWPVGGITGSQMFPENKVGNMLYQLDCMASITIGSAWLTFPSWLLHRQVLVPLDATHDMCGRLMGTLFIASHVIPQHALHWPDAEDRTIVVKSRVVCCVAVLGAQVWSQIAYKADWSGGHWVGISLFSTWTVIALLYHSYLFISGLKKKQC